MSNTIVRVGQGYIWLEDTIGSIETKDSCRVSITLRYAITFTGGNEFAAVEYMKSFASKLEAFFSGKVNGQFCDEVFMRDNRAIAENAVCSISNMTIDEVEVLHVARS